MPKSKAFALLSLFSHQPNKAKWIIMPKSEPFALLSLVSQSTKQSQMDYNAKIQSFRLAFSFFPIRQTKPNEL